MPNRGTIVDYTVAIYVDVLDPDGIWRPKVGYVTRPAIVIEDKGAAGVTLQVFGEPVGTESRGSVVTGVLEGPAAPDTRQGRRADPAAVPGQPGTWS